MSLLVNSSIDYISRNCLVIHDLPLSTPIIRKWYLNIFIWNPQEWSIFLLTFRVLMCLFVSTSVALLVMIFKYGLKTPVSYIYMCFMHIHTPQTLTLGNDETFKLELNEMLNPKTYLPHAYRLKGDPLTFWIILQICILTASCSMHWSEVGLAILGIVRVRLRAVPGFSGSGPRGLPNNANTLHHCFCESVYWGMQWIQHLKCILIMRSSREEEKGLKVSLGHAIHREIATINGA